jgi:hypothetical protein
VEQLDDAFDFMNTVLRTHAPDVLRDEPQLPTPVTKRKPAAPPTTVDTILRQKIRASPRNVVRLVPQ